MTTVFRVEGFSPIDVILHEAINRAKVHALGKSQKDEARAAGETLGYLRGVSTALVPVATQLRINLVDELLGSKYLDTEHNRHISAPDSWEIERFIEHWKHEMDSVPPIDPGAPKEERNNQRAAYNQRLEEKHVEMMTAWHDEIVWPQELRDTYEAQRKSLIRNGTLEPKQSDAEWLAEELQAMSAVTDPLQKLVAKAKNSNA